MDIAGLIRRDVVTVGTHHKLVDAARLMNEKKVGSAVVLTEDGRPGIITERDLLRAMAEGADPGAASVEDYMTANAITASPTYDAREAAASMLRGGFRHLVVVDKGGRVVGVLSIRDLFARFMEEPAPASRAT